MTKTETFAPNPSKIENLFGRERLTQEHLRQEMAKVALLALLISEFSRRDRDFLFADKPDTKPAAKPESKPDTSTTYTEVFGLISYALKHNEQRSTSDQAKGRARTGRESTRPGYHAFDESSPFAERHIFDDIRAYRDTLHQEPLATAAPVETPFLRPAPSMNETPLGPQMPNLAFNDRIRPTSRQPDQAAFAASERANDMYQRALLKQGWSGGESTEEQQRGAKRDIMRQYHPDRGDVTEEDVEAVKAFNAGMTERARASRGADRPAGPSANAA